MAVQGYLRFPTIAGDAVVFTAGDDLWRVSASGGRAERLTADVAEARNPRFSPDGRLIAYTGWTEGPGEVYVLSAEGGETKRLTFHGGASSVVGWRPDGSAIIYASAAGEPSPRMVTLHEIAPTGGLTTTLPYGPARSIAFGPHGAMVLGRNTAEPAFWKRYRGGTAGYLFVDPTGEGQFRRLLSLNSNITAPCWVGDRIYFISDHEGIGNVYSCLASGEDLRRHSDQTAYYARGLSSDGKRLVFFAGGDIYLLDPSAGNASRIDIALGSGSAQRARKFVSTAQYLDSWAVHPKGHALALTTRGKAFSMGNWDGPALQHGARDGIRYRHMQWLADGAHLVAVSDDGGEPQLTVFTADGSAPPRPLAGLDIGHVLELRVSPTAAQAALLNHRNEVLLADLDNGTIKQLDRTDFGRSGLGARNDGIAWSPDGRWLAYAFGINAQQSAIKLCRIETGETWQVTNPVLRDMRPAFDPAGRYLYFVGARTFDPVADNMLFEASFPKGVTPYLITLRRDLTSPFIPNPEPPKSEAEQQLEQGKKDEQPLTPKPVEIDLEGIMGRIVAFPVPEGRYERIMGTHQGAIFLSTPVEGTLNASWIPGTPEAKATLEGYTFETYKHEPLVEGISDFTVTPDGKTLLYRAGDRLRVLKAGEKPSNDSAQPGRESGWVDFDRIKVSVQPESEWRQIFAEAWRLQREQFWVADMGGVDWQAIYQRYETLLGRVGSRGELSDLMWEMHGELGSSHAYEIGGEYRPHPEYHQGHLGVDWRFDSASGRAVITRIVEGDAWNADATSPLRTPGVNAQVGDAILAINGQPVTKDMLPDALLVNQAGREVQVLLHPAAGGAARRVTVRAAADGFAGRYRDWVEANRKAVHDATNGRVGYLHIPDMGYIGFAEFHRYYLTEYDHDGLIVDVRFNGGGMVSGLVLEKLARRRLGYDFQRWGPAEPYLIQSPRGPLVALTDENAGSDGDIFSHAFKMLGLGPLIGMRTWGGVIGIEPYITLADGTVTTQPEFSFWFNDVGWGVENYGTDPTIEVEYLPQAYVSGKDPQLERAIAEALKLVEERPAPTPTPGPRPNRGLTSQQHEVVAAD
jgi:tricorn protease